MVPARALVSFERGGRRLPERHPLEPEPGVALPLAREPSHPHPGGPRARRESAPPNELDRSIGADGPRRQAERDEGAVRRLEIRADALAASVSSCARISTSHVPPVASGGSNRRSVTVPPFGPPVISGATEIVRSPSFRRRKDTDFRA
jgi:hypothetical protein